MENKIEKEGKYYLYAHYRKDRAISAKFLNKHLGYFKTKEKAEEKYIEVKIKYIVELAIKYRDSLTLRAFNTLSNIKIKNYVNNTM